MRQILEEEVGVQNEPSGSVCGGGKVGGTDVTVAYRHTKRCLSSGL